MKTVKVEQFTTAIQYLNLSKRNEMMCLQVLVFGKPVRDVAEGYDVTKDNLYAACNRVLAVIDKLDRIPDNWAKYVIRVPESLSGRVRNILRRSLKTIGDKHG